MSKVWQSRRKGVPQHQSNAAARLQQQGKLTQFDALQAYYVNFWLQSLSHKQSWQTNIGGVSECKVVL
jgi:hypothetical protein